MTDRIPEKARLEAAEWLVDLHSEPDSPQLKQRWQQWQDASPENARAWQQVEAFSRRISAIDPMLARKSLDAPSSDRRQALKALSVLIFSGGAVWYGRELPLVQGALADYRTTMGEIRTEYLADGSTVVLNTDTRLDVSYQPLRRLKLIRGEIFVTTASSPPAQMGPLVVEVAQGAIRPLGTEFMVSDLGDNSAHISVFKGAVELQPRQSGTTPVIIRAGEAGTLRYGDARHSGKAAIDGRSWLDGMLVARGQPLPLFLQQLARYMPGDFQTEAGARAVRVSGTFRLDSRNQILKVLQAAYQLQLKRQRRWWGEEQFIFSK